MISLGLLLVAVAGRWMPAAGFSVSMRQQYVGSLRRLSGSWTRDPVTQLEKKKKKPMPQGSSTHLLIHTKRIVKSAVSFSFLQPLRRHAQSRVVSPTPQTLIERCGIKQRLLSAFRFCKSWFSHFQFCTESSMNIFSLVLATWPLGQQCRPAWTTSTVFDGSLTFPLAPP